MRNSWKWVKTQMISHKILAVGIRELNVIYKNKRVKLFKNITVFKYPIAIFQYVPRCY